MSQRIVIRHTTGSKASTVEEFPVTAGSELLFGRGASCDIRFDEDREEFVSRRHMKLVVRDASGPEFTLVDLASRNGTFVNQCRVTGPALVQPGDVVQLGAGGPEFQFDVVAEDLRTNVPIENLQGALDASQSPLKNKPSRTASEVREPPASDSQRPASSRPARRVGRRALVSRRRPSRRNSRKNRVAGLFVMVAAVLVTWNFFGARWKLWRGPLKDSAHEFSAHTFRAFSASATLTPEQIARQETDSLVKIDHTWHLVDSASGRPIKQVYTPNRRELSGSGSAELVPNAGSDLPIFVLLAGNRLQPLLTFADQTSYRAIGGDSRGAGFVVASDGLVLTSRNVTSPWRSPYIWPSTDSVGVVASFDQQLKLARTAVIARRQFPRWLPVDTEFVLETLDQNSAHMSGPIRSKGVSESLIVHISPQGLNTPATAVKESDETQLAAIRLDPQALLQSVAMTAESDPKAGDELVIASMNSRPDGAKFSSVDARGRYQLLSGTIEAGTPGAPIFDRRGLVVAVESAGDPLHPDITFAIPIHRALESVGHPSSRRPSS